MVEIALTDKVQIAEKGNAHCQMCSKLIQKGEPRLQRFRHTQYGFHPDYICYKCANKELENEEGELKDNLILNTILKKNLADTKKKCSKVLIANTLMEIVKGN